MPNPQTPPRQSVSEQTKIHGKLYHEASVNLARYPEVLRPLKVDEQLTIGSLHGNSLKLLHTLVKHQVVKNVSKEDFEKFENIYSSDFNITMTQEKLSWFNQWVSGYEFNPCRLIRFMGNLLCGQGNNDYFTLKILEQMHLKKVSYEICFSNHDYEFLARFYKQEAYNTNKHIPIENTCSMQNMHYFIEKNLVRKNVIDNIISNCYLPRLKLISYSLDFEQRTISFYAYARFQFRKEVLRNLFSQLGANYFNCNSFNGLMKTIDAINVAFGIMAQNGTLVNFMKFPTGYENAHYNSDLRARINGEGDLSYVLDPIKHALVYIIWKKGDLESHPLTIFDWQINYVTSHHKVLSMNAQYHINLNAYLGCTNNHMEGFYYIHICQDALAYKVKTELQSSEQEYSENNLDSSYRDSGWSDHSEQSNQAVEEKIKEGNAPKTFILSPSLDNKPKPEDWPENTSAHFEDLLLMFDNMERNNSDSPRSKASLLF